jgi:hypothetical protein
MIFWEGANGGKRLQFAVYGFWFAVCGLQVVSCQSQIALLLPAVYFVVEIASMC